jgi:alpha-tubulin suppressor-like RCC1 family protein
MKNLTFLFVILFVQSKAQCWQAISVGSQHCLGIKTDGTLWAWGSNARGELGDISLSDQSAPLQVGTDSDWRTILAGHNHSIALKSDRTRWGCGFNANGQLGDGTFDDIQHIAQIDTLADWISIYGHTRAICFSVKPDGSLWTWGYNGTGLAGTGNQNDNPSPVQVGTDYDWQMACSGVYHSLAVKTNGTLWAAGAASQGAFGNGGTTSSSTFIQISSDTTWHLASAGNAYSAAIRTDGTLWTWGWNNKGQLGVGNMPSSLVPVQVGNSTWKNISCGEDHTLGVKNDGTLWAWGNNDVGQLGDGTFINRNTPVQIGIAADWIFAATGGEFTHPGFSLAIKTDGTVWTWGDNSHGQLGDGTTVNKNIPVPLISSGCSAVDIKNFPAMDFISVFPNPVKDVLCLKNESKKKIEKISIIDLAERILMQIDFAETVYTEGLSPGMYLLKYRCSGNDHQLKFIKE